MGHFVPITEGGSSALFVGTYLPGGGTTVGMKKALGPELDRLRPADEPRDYPATPAQLFLSAVIAPRNPELTEKESVSLEAKRNFERYALGQPVQFTQMMGSKGLRMWSRYARGGFRTTSTALRIYHCALVLFALGGVLLTLRRRHRRQPLQTIGASVLILLLSATAVHMVFVSQGRYNLPLMPILLAVGIAGWSFTARHKTSRQPLRTLS